MGAQLLQYHLNITFTILVVSHSVILRVSFNQVMTQELFYQKKIEQSQTLAKAVFLPDLVHSLPRDYLFSDQ